MSEDTEITDIWRWMFPGLTVQDAETCAGGIIARYAEPHRRYHGVDHLCAVVNEFSGHKDLAENQQAVMFALWMHDAVYDSRSKFNEENSSLACLAIGNAGGNTQIGIDAARLVLLTQHATVVDDTLTTDGKLVLDIDLSILGSDPETFETYEQEIREEYDHVEDDAFAHGRAAVLESFNKREHIYRTETFRQKYEAQARTNLDVAIRKWRQWS